MLNAEKIAAEKKRRQIQKKSGRKGGGRKGAGGGVNNEDPSIKRLNPLEILSQVPMSMYNNIRVRLLEQQQQQNLQDQKNGSRQSGRSRYNEQKLLAVLGRIYNAPYKSTTV